MNVNFYLFELWNSLSQSFLVGSLNRFRVVSNYSINYSERDKRAQRIELAADS